MSSKVLWLLLGMLLFTSTVAGSDTGTRIFFIREDKSVYSIRLDGSEDTMVAERLFDDDNAVDMDVSASGTIVFVYDCSIYILREEGYYFELVPSNGDFEARRPCNFNPVWSPDEQEILFCSSAFRLSGNDIYAIHVDGTQLRRITDGDPTVVWTCGDPQWSPDGSRVAFSLATGMLHSLMIVDADGANYQILPTCFEADCTPLAGFPSWSPDGQYLAYSGSNTIGIFVSGLDAQQWSIEATNTLYPPSWSPDSTAIVYDVPAEGAPETGEIHVASRDGESLSHLTNGWHPVWSPDGEYIAFILGGDIYTIHPDGTALFQVTHAGDVLIDVLEWIVEE